MQPYPRAPDLVWPGHLHGTGCLSARAVGTGFPTVGLRLWLGPGCGWSWVLFTPARCGWGLGWVCLGWVCGVVPLLPAVCGVRGWALVSACFRDLCAPRRFRFRCAVWTCVLGPGLGCAPPFLAGLLGCVFCAFFFSGFWVSLSWALWSLSPSPFFRAGLLASSSFFFCLFRCPFSRWAAVPGLVLPVLAGWSPCACLGVLSSVPSGWGVWPPSVLLAGGGLVAVGCFRAPPPLFFGGGGGEGAAWLFLPLPSLGWRLLCGWCVVWLVPRHSWRRFLCATPRHSWLGFAAGGGGRSPPLLAGVRLRQWCVVCGVWRSCVGGVVAGVWCGWSLATLGGGSCVLLPATPGWVSLPVVVGGPRLSWLGSACGGDVWCVVCGVWCVAVVCWWGCGWCVVWLVPRHSWRRFLCATPRHSWLGFAAGGGGRSPPLLAGVCRRRWCVVCGAGVLVGLWLVCGVVGPSPLLAEVPVCYSPPLLAGFRCRWWWAVPATPGWGPLAALLCGVWCVAVVCWWGCGWCVVWLVPRHSWRRFLCATARHSWLGFAAGGGGRSPPLLAWVRWRRRCVVCGGGVLLGLWLVCGVVGPSPLLAEVPVCYSPPLLAGFRCRWWWAVPATPGWGPLAAVGGGVWCVVCGGGVLTGLWLVCGVVGPSPLLAEVPVCYSPPLLAGFRCRWWWAVPATPGWGPLAAVVCGVWCVVCGGGVLVGLWLLCGVVGPSPLLAEVLVCYSPPLLAGFRCRWWWAVPATPGLGPLAASVCGVWRWCVVGVVAGVWCGWSLATPGGGPCVLLPATPGWVSLPVVVGGPRHSWLGSVGGGGVWCVVCGVLLGSLATPGGGSCVLLPVTPGWVSLPLVVGGPRHSWLRSACGGGVRALLGRVGRAGLPGALWCASPFPLAALSFCFAWPPPGWGCPSLFRCCCRSSLVVFLGFPLPGSRIVCVSRLAVGCSLVVAPPPPPPWCLAVFVAPACGLGVFFFFFLLPLLPPCAPVVSGFLGFPAPGALGLGACVVCFVGLPLLGSPCACPSFVLSAWLSAAPAWLLPPPPPLCLAVFVPAARCCVPCCAVRPWVRCCAALLRVVSPGVALLCAVLRALVPLLVAPCPLALPVALGPCALRRCVLRCSPALCALCCVCFVVARWCVLLFAAPPCAVCVSGCFAVRSLCSPFCAVLCFAVLVRSRCAVRVVRAVAGAWCCGALLCVVLFPVVCRGAVLGLVARGCLLVACFGVGVPVWPPCVPPLRVLCFLTVGTTVRLEGAGGRIGREGSASVTRTLIEAACMSKNWITCRSSYSRKVFALCRWSKR